MKTFRILSILAGVLCILIPLTSSAQTPDAPPETDLRKFDQKDIPPASQKERSLAASRKKIVDQRNATVNTLTKLDVAIMDEKNPQKRAALSKQRNVLRAKLIGYEQHMKAMEKQIAKMITARVEVANPSVTGQAEVDRVKLLRRQMAMATERATARAKMGKTVNDPEYTMMTERVKTYIAQMGSITTRLTPSETKELAAPAPKASKTKSKK
ncbi:MAG: hypothetical protein ACYC1M_02270 [Armatimonadota bacterium]